MARLVQVSKWQGLHGVTGVDARARSRMGCLMSTGMGSVDIFEAQIHKAAERGPRAVSPYFVPGVMPNGSAPTIWAASTRTASSGSMDGPTM